MRGRIKVAARWALALYAVFVAFILLGPSATLPTECVSFLTRLAHAAGFSPTLATPDRVEFLANVLIVVPVGLLGELVWPRLNWRDWTTVGFVLSSLVELSQALLLPERTATFVDVVANTLGTGLGALVAGVCLSRNRAWLDQQGRLRPPHT